MPQTSEITKQISKKKENPFYPSDRFKTKDEMKNFLLNNKNLKMYHCVPENIVAPITNKKKYQKNKSPQVETNRNIVFDEKETGYEKCVPVKSGPPNLKMFKNLDDPEVVAKRKKKLEEYGPYHVRESPFCFNEHNFESYTDGSCQNVPIKSKIDDNGNVVFSDDFHGINKNKVCCRVKRDTVDSKLRNLKNIKETKKICKYSLDVNKGPLCEFYDSESKYSKGSTYCDIDEHNKCIVNHKGKAKFAWAKEKKRLEMENLEKKKKRDEIKSIKSQNSCSLEEENPGTFLCKRYSKEFVEYNDSVCKFDKDASCVMNAKGKKMFNEGKLQSFFERKTRKQKQLQQTLRRKSGRLLTQKKTKDITQNVEDDKFTEQVLNNMIYIPKHLYQYLIDEFKVMLESIINKDLSNYASNNNIKKLRIFMQPLLLTNEGEILKMVKIVDVSQSSEISFIYNFLKLVFYNENDMLKVSFIQGLHSDILKLLRELQTNIETIVNQYHQQKRNILKSKNNKKKLSKKKSLSETESEAPINIFGGDTSPKPYNDIIIEDNINTLKKINNMLDAIIENVQETLSDKLRVIIESHQETLETLNNAYNVFKNILDNNKDEKTILKETKRKALIKIHPDRNKQSQKSNEMFQLINGVLENYE